VSSNSKIIFTGGSGLLGSEFVKIRPDIDYPSSGQFNVTNYDQMKKYVEPHGCKADSPVSAFAGC
jgi:dTDP-4-dehydrorhamnose reductase